jgi:hypothetical protein
MISRKCRYECRDMTNVALMQLQQQIEAMRREAFAEGYAAAMQRVGDFAARPQSAPLAATAARSGASDDAAPGTPGRQRRTRPHGTNAQLVAAVLESIAPRAAPPSEIRRLLLREQGVALAFTSIRHALGQLGARGAAEQIAASRTWRHASAGTAAAADD